MTYVQLDGVDDFIEMDSPQLSVTDLDVTVDVALDDWTPSSEEALFTDRNSGDGFTLAVHTSGGFRVYTNGTVNTTTDPGLADGTRHTIRALYDGAAGTVEIYVDGVLHDTETGSIPASLDANPFTSLYVGSGIIGASDNASGKFYGFTAIYDGTTEIDVDFANFDSGATSGTATAGGTVTIDGSSVTQVVVPMADLTHSIKISLGGTLTDVTDVVQGFTAGGGRQREYETFSAGTASIRIVDVGNVYVPGGGGTYGSETWIGREVLITVSAGGNTATVFRGHVEDIDVEFVDVNHAIITVDAVDPFGLLARTEIGSSATFDSELSSARVNAVLDLDEVDGGYWVDAVRDIHQGVATLQADADPAGNTLAYLQSVERSEGGRLFVRHGDNGGGVLAFRPRVDSGGPKVKFERVDTGDIDTLVDGGTAETTSFVDTFDGGTAADMPAAALDGGTAVSLPSVKFQTVDVNFGYESLVNRVAFTREGGGSEQVVEDVASKGRFGIRTVSQSGLLNATDADVLDLAETRLARAAAPQRNTDGLSVLLDVLSDDKAAMVARLTVGDRVRVEAEVPGSGGEILTQDVRIEQVRHDVTPSAHRVSYRLTTLSDEFAGLTDGGNAETVSFADTWDGGTAEDVQRDRVLDGGDATFV